MNEIDIMDIRLVSIISLTILGLGAMIIDGEVGEAMTVAISGFIGTVIGWGFGRASCKEVEDEKEVP